MTKELVESFMYVGSTRELWIEVEARFGESNSPMIYQLQREIGQVTQEWYKDMAEQKKKTGGRGRGYSALMTDESGMKVAENNYPNLTELVRLEMRKLMNDETPSDPLRINFAQLDNFAGSIQLTPEIKLDHVLHIPEFSDLKTEKVLATAYLLKNLYILESKLVSETRSPLKSICSSHSYTFDMDHLILWHQRLGHLSSSSMKHITNLPSMAQNGVAERKHRFLLNIARSIMFQASFPYQFWGDAILGANHLINRFPTVVLDWKSPYEKLYDKPPSYSHLRVIGCLCFAIRPEPQLSKFDKRASKCVFVGYPPGQKGYKVYDLDSKSFFTFRNVIFHEDQFPFCSDTLPSSTVPLAVIPLTEDINDTSLDSSPPTTQSSPNTVPVIRRSIREHHKPSWLNDFEPRSYKQAADIPHWVEAMKLELAALERNQTWKVVPLSAGKTPIGCKWVFKSKLREDVSVERHKARIVAKGYTQVEGVDYNERFSPVAKCVTVRLFLTLASAFQWPLHEIDINNAFLHGHLDEEIYMAAPEGYKVDHGHACLLQRSPYALPSGFIGLLVYVDDVLLMAPSLDAISQVKSYLDGLFTIKDLGYARFFIGVQIARSEAGISLTQSKYILDIITDYGLQNAKSAITPLPPKIKLQRDSGDHFADPERYRHLIGRLLYLCFMRPDISHSVQQLSQFMQAPSQSHWTVALHLVRYSKGCSGLGLFSPSSNSLQLQAFCDADWGACLDTRCSLTGFAVFLGPALISWKTKKQCTVSRSSAEAEYRSMAATTCELQWISYLLKDFGVFVSLPIPFHCDNQAAIHIMANPVVHERTKHLDIDCHIVRNCYKDGFLLPVFVRSRDQIADLLTKPLCSALFHGLLGKLGLFAIDPSPTCGGGGVENIGKSGETKVKIGVG
ncbi:UNVERIFIED_CONTAM: Retrovirus-related Pol polyprotein from transposon RE1 [Sesamum indicum]